MIQATPQDLRVAIQDALSMATGQDFDRYEIESLINIDIKESQMTAEFTVQDTDNAFSVDGPTAMVYLLKRLSEDHPVLEKANFEPTSGKSVVTVEVPVDSDMAAAYSVSQKQRRGF